MIFLWRTQNCLDWQFSIGESDNFTCSAAHNLTAKAHLYCPFVSCKAIQRQTLFIEWIYICILRSSIRFTGAPHVQLYCFSLKRKFSNPTVLDIIHSSWTDKIYTYMNLMRRGFVAAVIFSASNVMLGVRSSYACR